MKKIFQAIGIITLICGSFFLTDKAALVINNMDQIMIDIKNNCEQYTVYAQDAIIFDNYIIPGSNGRVVNIDRSYKNMRQIGVFNENYLVYDDIEPSISLNKNKHLYIKSGNHKKRAVTIGFVLDQNQDISSLLNIIKNYNIKVTFFISEQWLNNHNDLTINLLKQNHTVGIYDYNNDSLKWIDTVLKKIGNQNNGFCLLNSENADIEDECKDLNNYLLTDDLIIKKEFLKTTQRQLNSGSILIFPVNHSLESELTNIILYIESKGLEIISLDELISEKIG